MYSRYHDTETKVLEDIAYMIDDRLIEGEIKFHTERPLCQSYSNITAAFKKIFLNIKLGCCTQNRQPPSNLRYLTHHRVDHL